MRRLLREPLVQFLLAGGALFLLHGWLGSDEPGSQRVRVDAEQVARLREGFRRTWARPPTAAELAGLIDDWVTEEVLYREALALGLDRDDTVVRRRMRQKMEFLSDDWSERAPSEAELEAFLAAHPERYRVPARLDLEQVFVAPEPEPSLESRAATRLARLRAGDDPAGLGDATLLPRRLAGATPRTLAGSFGDDFAAAVAALPEGQWHGPLRSAFGAHLVRVSARVPGRMPSLEEVRGALERDWAEAERERGRQRFHAAMRARYRIEVAPLEGTEVVPPDAGAAAD